MTGLRWGICAQVKADQVAVETFVAHHLELGADRVAVYFDDPEDGAIAASLARFSPRIETHLCDTAHWQALNGRRPGKKTVRQTANATDAYRRMPVDWMAHIDVDEFILPFERAASVAALLAAVPPDEIILRLRPYEALSNPDGTPPHQFRAPPEPGPQRAAIVQRLYGAQAVGLIDGVIAHSVGKCFFRTGVAGLTPKIHSGQRNGARVDRAGFSADMALLHYHAVDRDAWLAHVAYRAEHGAYSGRPARQAFYQTATEADLRAFHDAVQTAGPALLDRLAAEHLLLTAEPGLEASRDRLFGPLTSR